MNIMDLYNKYLEEYKKRYEKYLKEESYTCKWIIIYTVITDKDNLTTYTKAIGPFNLFSEAENYVSKLNYLNDNNHDIIMISSPIGE